MKKRLRARVRTGAGVAVAAFLVLPAAAFAHFGDHTLATGSTGHDVKVLQSWLTHMGFTTSIDGSFGRNTRWNVRRFEQAKGLRQTLGLLETANVPARVAPEAAIDARREAHVGEPRLQDLHIVSS